VRGRVKWYYDTLTPGMAIFTIALSEAIEHIVDEIAQEIEDYMKAEAPWEDQTGAARQGLTAKGHREGTNHVIDLYYTVDYGFWLEVKWNGRFAIIQPTMEKYGPILMGALNDTYEVA